MTDLSVDRSDALREEIALASHRFGVQCSVVPTRGDKFEQVVSLMRRVCGDVVCPPLLQWFKDTNWTVSDALRHS